MKENKHKTIVAIITTNIDVDKYLMPYKNIATKTRLYNYNKTNSRNIFLSTNNTI